MPPLDSVIAPPTSKIIMSSLINIDQVRAAQALSANGVHKNDGEGDNLSGYPSLIINNGLIATVAFSVDKGGQHKRIADALAAHLQVRKILTASSAVTLRDALCNAPSSTLRRATRESLEFLAYLKRFHRS